MGAQARGRTGPNKRAFGVDTSQESRGPSLCVLCAGKKEDGAKGVGRPLSVKNEIVFKPLQQDVFAQVRPRARPLAPCQAPCLV